MSLDPHSLELLQELGRQLPKHIPPPNHSNNKQPPQKHQHQIETETDPKSLFRELIKASPDGNVPIHLLKRLKALETKENANKYSELDPKSVKKITNDFNQSTSKLKQKSLSTSNNELTSLYEAFEDLLIESEEER